MDFMISGEFTKYLLTVAKKDKTMTHAIALQLVHTVSPEILYSYLLTPQVAESLLADRLQKNPEKTLRELEGLAKNGRGTKSRRPSKNGRKVTLTAKVPRGVKRRNKRQRLSLDRIEEFKTQVLKFLSANRWATRKQIGTVVAIPTQAIYTRIMSELRQSKQIVSKGEKSKTVYSLKGSLSKLKATRKTKSKSSKTRS